ncbi:MAG TPA: HAD hydrolase family protein [Kiritimatiellia bacterium]|nr:HAD hydrolase family protein [Kiritimatiellia bacterium]
MKGNTIQQSPTSVGDIRLISLDFDGTILVYDDPEGLFHDDVIFLLNDLQCRGIRWCANSGRDKNDQLAVLQRSVERGLTHMPDALICSESLVFVRNGSGYVPLEPWNSRAHDDLRACHAQVQVALDSKLGYIQKTYQPISTLIGDLFTAFFIHDRDGMPIKLFNDLQRFLKDLDGVMLTRNGGWVAVMHDGLGKGNALKAYAQHLDLPRDHILAIGDQFNDLPMLLQDVACHLGCPGDAIPEVRNAVRKAKGIVADEPGPLGTIQVIRRLTGMD